MADITIPLNDYGYYLNFTVTDENGDAYNLTGYTITLKVWEPGKYDDPIIEGACSIVSAANGTCRYLIADGDFTSIKNYYAEIELTRDGVVESMPSFKITVTESA